MERVKNLALRVKHLMTSLLPYSLLRFRYSSSSRFGDFRSGGLLSSVVNLVYFNVKITACSF